MCEGRKWKAFLRRVKGVYVCCARVCMAGEGTHSLAVTETFVLWTSTSLFS